MLTRDWYHDTDCKTHYNDGVSQTRTGTVVRDMVITFATENKYNNLPVCKFYRRVTHIQLVLWYCSCICIPYHYARLKMFTKHSTVWPNVTWTCKEGFGGDTRKQTTPYQTELQSTLVKTNRCRQLLHFCQHECVPLTFCYMVFTNMMMCYNADTVCIKHFTQQVTVWIQHSTVQYKYETPRLYSYLQWSCLEFSHIPYSQQE